MDAVSLDATHLFIAGKCGLVPVVTEYYGKTHCLLKSILKMINTHSILLHGVQQMFIHDSSVFTSICAYLYCFGPLDCLFTVKCGP